jgi:regulatory protein
LEGAFSTPFFHTAMVILEITSDKKDTVLVSTDQGSFRINKDVCASKRLRPGMELEKEQWLRIVAENDKKEAFLKGLQYVSRKKCSVRELCELLARKGFCEEAIESAASKLAQYGYVDDREYARSYMASSAGKGRLRTSFELSRKGISPELIEEFSKSPEKELGECLATAERFLKGSAPQDAKAKQRLYRHLCYRGFDRETISQVLAALKGEGTEEI